MAGYKALVLLFFLCFLCISDATTIGKYNTYYYNELIHLFKSNQNEKQMPAEHLKRL